MSKEKIEKMAKVIETTEQIARDAHCGYPSPRMYATDLHNKGYRDQSEVAREILSEIRAAYEKYGGATGMKLKIDELEKRFISGRELKDFVEVVRCKNCVYANENKELCGMYECRLYRDMRKDCDYCNYGKRREL